MGGRGETIEASGAAVWPGAQLAEVVGCVGCAGGATIPATATRLPVSSTPTRWHSDTSRPRLVSSWGVSEPRTVWNFTWNRESSKMCGSAVRGAGDVGRSWSRPWKVAGPLVET